MPRSCIEKNSEELGLGVNVVDYEHKPTGWLIHFNNGAVWFVEHEKIEQLTKEFNVAGIEEFDPCTNYKFWNSLVIKSWVPAPADLLELEPTQVAPKKKFRLFSRSNG